jgi:hypothetical protein
MTVLWAFLRGGIGGFVIGFLTSWLYPIYEGIQPRSFVGVCTSLCGVPWLGVFLFAAFFACFWAGSSFKRDTEIGFVFRVLSDIFYFWR